MIARLNERTHTPHDPLAEALGRPVSADEGLTEYTVVAYWPGLDNYTLDDEQTIWTSAQWAEHLEDPLLEHPFAASPQDDRRAISHIDIRLHPDDRELTGPEWAEAAHRLARAAGLEAPGEENSCRWIAVHAQPRRLDLIANLIRLDGSWNTPSAKTLKRIMEEARRIERDLRLIPPRTPPSPPPAARPVASASALHAATLAQLADEAGPLAAVRGLVEHAAHRLTRQPGAAAGDAAHRLELIARRIHSVQQDLDTTAAHLQATVHTLPVVPSAAARAVPRSP